MEKNIQTPVEREIPDEVLWRDASIPQWVHKKNKTSISIERLIDLYTEDKLRYRRPGSIFHSYHYVSEGEYFVDYNNPLVKTVVDMLDEINQKVEDKNNIRLLEDRIDAITNFGKEAAVCLYIVSGLGMIHLIYSSLRDRKATIKSSVFNGALKLTEEGIKKASKVKNVDYISALKRAGKETADAAYDLTLNSLAAMYYTGRWGLRGSAKLALFPFKLGHKAAMPILRTADPRKYPSYAAGAKNISKKVAYGSYRFVSRNISELFEQNKERRKSNKERRIRLKEEKRIKKEIKKKEKARLKSEKLTLTGKISNLAGRFSSYLKEAYKESLIYRYFGYGMTGTEKFNNLNRSHLEHLVSLSKVGRMYFDYLSYVDEMDKLIARGVDERPLKVVLAYNDNPEFYQRNVINKKGRFSLDISSTLLTGDFHKRLETVQDADVQDSVIAKKLLGKEALASEKNHFDFTILDILLHQRAHHALKAYNHKYDPNEDGLHPAGFHEKKAEYRRKFIDYMLKNGINLSEYMDSSLTQIPESDTTDPFYNISVKEFANMTRMTRRCLKNARAEIMYDRTLKNQNDKAAAGYNAYTPDRKTFTDQFK